MYYIGYDIGSSSVKVAIVDAQTGQGIMALHEPTTEMDIKSPKMGWAEQDPNIWWDYVCKATKKAIKDSNIAVEKIEGIGISYQMHGLVVVDKLGNPLRDSIIWCDSRAIEIGNSAFDALGHEHCMKSLLNSPGNFTASKLKWVRDNEPEIYDQVYKYMLPGDYIAFKLTGDINTTRNGLSEGILWDYSKGETANWLLEYYGIDTNLTPEIVENFDIQCRVNKKGALESGLPMGIPITYRSGDQPNNALSLNVFNNGEVAATGGTSGVIYAVTNQKQSNEPTRINHFAHVNYSENTPNLGKLLCINGAGIQYRWLKDNMASNTYEAMNAKANLVPIGSKGLCVIPFGNGAERMLDNKNLGTHFCNLNLNIHTEAHLFRAALEGIAFSFVYGMEILKQDHTEINVIRAGNDNLFRSEIFSNTVATLIGHDIEIYNTTGAIGAARAVSLTEGNFKRFGDYLSDNDLVNTYSPQKHKAPYLEAYNNWKTELEIKLKHK